MACSRHFSEHRRTYEGLQTAGALLPQSADSGLQARSTKASFDGRLRWAGACAGA